MAEEKLTKEELEKELARRKKHTSDFLRYLIEDKHKEEWKSEGHFKMDEKEMTTFLSVSLPEERAKRRLLELQLKEAQELGGLVAQKSSPELLSESIKEYINNTINKTLDQRLAATEVIKNLSENANLTLSKEIPEEVASLDESNSRDQRIRNAILTMREEGLLKYNYYYVYVMQVINETESIKLQFDYTTTFVKYLSGLGIDKLPKSNDLAKQMCNIKGKFPNWSFKDVKDSQKSTDRTNVAKRFLALYNKGK